MRYVCLFQFELITCAVCSAHCTHIMQSFCCQCFHLYICAKERMRMNKLSMSGKSKFEASSQQIFSVSLLMTKDKVKLRRRILACKPQNTSSQANNLYPHPLFVNIIIITINKYASLWDRPCSMLIKNRYEECYSMETQKLKAK